MRWWLACFAVMVAQAQAPAPEPSLLDKVKARAAENLRRLPNYTCTEAIQRALRLGLIARFQAEATVRLDVAYVEGKEWFGRPSEGKIDQSSVEELASGTIGNGQFALFVKGIFMGKATTFGSPVNTKLEAKPAFRFDYSIPLLHSGFHIKSAAGEAVVGYSGSFWVRRDTLDLMRLVVSGDDLPPRLKLVSDVTSIDYGPVPIGGTVFLLPRHATYDSKDVFGSEARNHITFENCHEFVGESILKFGDAEHSPANK
jgi:hypothetical protein